MTEETDERWWERTKSELRRAGADALSPITPEEFEALKDDLAADDRAPLSSDQIDRLLRRVEVMLASGVTDGRLPPLLGMAASGSTVHSEIGLLDHFEIVSPLGSDPTGLTLVADGDGNVAIPAPAGLRATHLQVGSVQYPLRLEPGMARVEGLGRADLEEYLASAHSHKSVPLVKLVTVRSS